MIWCHPDGNNLLIRPRTNYSSGQRAVDSSQGQKLGAFYPELGLGGDHRGHTGITQRLDIWGKQCEHGCHNHLGFIFTVTLTFMSIFVFFTSRYCFIKYKNLHKPFPIVSKIGYNCHSHHHLMWEGDMCLTLDEDPAAAPRVQYAALWPGRVCKLLLCQQENWLPPFLLSPLCEGRPHWI